MGTYSRDTGLEQKLAEVKIFLESSHITIRSRSLVTKYSALGLKISPNTDTSLLALQLHIGFKVCRREEVLLSTNSQNTSKHSPNTAAPKLSSISRELHSLPPKSFVPSSPQVLLSVTFVHVPSSAPRWMLPIQKYYNLRAPVSVYLRLTL